MKRMFVTLGAVVLVSGCGGAPPHRAERPKRSGPPPAAGAPAAGASASARPIPPVRAKDGDHVAACRDGECEVTVRDGTKIPLSRRFGMGPIAVAVDGDDVRLRAHSPDTDMSDTVTAPGTITLNGITVEILDAHDGVATLRVSHR